MKILFITPRLPYPLIKGDQARAYHQIKCLSRQHAITLVSFIRNEKELEYLPELKLYCSRIETVKLGRLTSLWSGLWHIFSSTPLQTWLFTSALMRQTINAIIEKERFDLVHLQLIRMGEYLSGFKKIHCLLDFIDALSLNMSNRAKQENILLKLPVYWEYLKTKQYERKLLDKVQAAIIVSERDKQAISGDDKITVVPIGVDLDRFSYQAPDHAAKDLVFTGNLKYFPNQDAVIYFCKKALPAILRASPQTKFYIIGANPPAKIRKLANSRIIVKGSVANMAQSFTKNMVAAICPLRAGSGVQFKILEAMAAGVPVVAFDQVARSLAVKDGQEILFAPNTSALIQQVLRLLNDYNLRLDVSRCARIFIENNFTWELACAKLEGVYKRMLYK